MGRLFYVKLAILLGVLILCVIFLYTLLCWAILVVYYILYIWSGKGKSCFFTQTTRWAFVDVELRTILRLAAAREVENFAATFV